MVSKTLASALKKAKNLGRGGDTMLAHINPREAQVLKSLGGSGTINPHTGLREFDNPSMGDYGGGGYGVGGSNGPSANSGDGASSGGSWNSGGGGNGGGGGNNNSNYIGGSNLGKYSGSGNTTYNPATGGTTTSGNMGGYLGNGNSNIGATVGATGLAKALQAGQGIASSIGSAFSGLMSSVAPTVSNIGTSLNNSMLNASDALNAGLANGYSLAKDYVSQALSPTAAPASTPSYTTMAANSGLRSEAASGDPSYAGSSAPSSSFAPSVDHLGNMMNQAAPFGGVEIMSPFTGTPLGVMPSSQQQMLNQLGISGSPVQGGLPQSKAPSAPQAGTKGIGSDAVASALNASAATGLPASVFTASTTLNPAWNGSPTADNLQAEVNAAKMVLGPMANGLRPEYLAKLGDAIGLMGTSTGARMVGVSGLRDLATQAALYAQGRTAPGSIVTNAVPGTSFHNYGLATDMVPSSLLNTPNWTPSSSLWSAWGNAAQQAGLTWGGNFSNLNDVAHTQLGNGSPSAVASALDKGAPVATTTNTQVAQSAPSVAPPEFQMPASGVPMPPSYPTQFTVDGTQLLNDIRANNYTFGASDQTIADSVIANAPEGSVTYNPDTNQFSVTLSDVNQDGTINQSDYNAVVANFVDKAKVDPSSYTVADTSPLQYLSSSSPQIVQATPYERQAASSNLSLSDLAALQSSTAADVPVQMAQGPYERQAASSNLVGSDLVDPNVYASPLNLPAQPNTALAKIADTLLGLIPGVGMINTGLGLFGKSLGSQMANSANVPMTPQEAADLEARQFATRSNDRGGNEGYRLARAIVERRKKHDDAMDSASNDSDWKKAARDFGYTDAQLKDPQIAALIKQLFDMGMIPA